MEHVVAVDIGGTKLATAVVDSQGTILAEAMSPTEGADAQALFDVVVDLVDAVVTKAAVSEASLLACGVGSGGPMARFGETVSPLNIEQWREFPLKRGLADHLGLPTWLDNDGKALALGEGWLGAARGKANFMSMVVSTGVGGGIVLDGRLLDGQDGNAGHIGHLIVEPDGRQCGCGAFGCLEAEASGTAIAAITGRDPAEADDDMKRRTGTLVGRGVASVCNLLDLELVCVAGSVALGYGDLFFDAAQTELTARARIGHARGSRIVVGGLAANGPLIGAAAVAWRGLGHDIGVL